MSILGVARSTYYKSLNKTESIKAKENKELKLAIQRIYKHNKSRYGSPKIHYMLVQEGYKVSEKRVQRLMRELNLYTITVKKYKPTSNKKVIEGLENVLKQDFSTTSINGKWVRDITYIYILKA